MANRKIAELKNSLRNKFLQALLSNPGTREKISLDSRVIELINFSDCLQNSHFKEYENLEVNKLLLWFGRGFASPAPNLVKWELMARFGSKNVWIETGTYLGETTQILGNRSSKVYTIEPSLELVNLAKLNCGALTNIEFFNGLSENLIEKIIISLNVPELKDVSFWLDGHYSAGNTFQGPSATPIRKELEIISQHLPKFQQLTIFVDDVRGFPTNQQEETSAYPEINWLVDWAESNKMYWMIEHDIFMISKKEFKYDL
jgi:hypothetical protein